MRNNIWTTQQQVQSIKHIPKSKLQNSDIPLTKTHNNLSKNKKYSKYLPFSFHYTKFSKNQQYDVLYNIQHCPQGTIYCPWWKKSKILFVPTIYVNLIFTFVSRCIWIEIIKSFKVFWYILISFCFVPSLFV